MTRDDILRLVTTPQLFHCLRYTDADRGIAWLEALGFQSVLVVRDPDDPSFVAHAQLAWRDHGGVMLGSTRGSGDDRYAGGMCNLVVTSDAEVDRLVAVAVGAGGSVRSAPTDAPHGGRNACVLDPEGHAWNLDSYPGA